MKLLTKEQQKSCENEKIPYTCEKKLKINVWKVKNIEKLEIIVIIQANVEVLHIVNVTENLPKKTPIVFIMDQNMINMVS